ncbi:MAG: hypothetical protein GY832_45725 [Chloroflexi bacterium]|nr:hypothetical protein [Chloroflexota bacterium]
MNWDEYCDKYLDALEKHNRKWGGSFHGIESFTSHYMLNLIDTEPNIVPKFTQTSNKDIQWFLNALMDEKRKQFALILVAQTERLPNEFLPVLVQTALLDYPENFIGVACRFFGSVRVAKALFKYTLNTKQILKKK